MIQQNNENQIKAAVTSSKQVVPTDVLYKLSLINQQHIESLKVAFGLMDDDDSGTISAKELSEVVNRFKEVDEEELEDLIAESEEFQDGELQFEEFLTFMLSKITKKSSCEKYLQEVFDYFDTESKTLLGPEQLKGMMNDHGAEAEDYEINQMVEDAVYTVANEGQINFDDFIRPIKFPEDEK